MVTRSSMPPYDEYIEKIKPLWESAWLTNMGVLHKEFGSWNVSFIYTTYEKNI